MSAACSPGKAPRKSDQINSLPLQEVEMSHSAENVFLRSGFPFTILFQNFHGHGLEFNFFFSHFLKGQYLRIFDAFGLLILDITHYLAFANVIRRNMLKN